MKIKTKLIAIGAGTALGLASLLAIGWSAGSRTVHATDTARAVALKVEVIGTMAVAELALILAAMDSIVDREDGKMAPERVQVVVESLKTIREGEAAAREVAALIGKPDLMKTFSADLEQVAQAVQVTLPALLESRASADAFSAIDDAIDDGGARLESVLATLSKEGTALVDLDLDLASEAAHSAKTMQIVAAILFLVLTCGMIAFISRGITRSLGRLREDMECIASGELDREIDGADRNDEIGEMAASLVEFRHAAREKVRMEREAEESRVHSETERSNNEAAKARETAAIKFAVDQLAANLERLSTGDLTVRIDAVFAGDLERLRHDFNDSVEKLGGTLKEIADTTNAVRLSANEIGDATDDLSRRTEHQAASLEETAAALDQITATVKSASERADEASAMVGATKTGAEKSGAVVRKAITAMERIEDSSRQISQIISVIDDIAFQTNLLALNAGVEAARAGEAGKGFAVVAQEVRELAQRSANAAKEIKALIETSSAQVGNGVSLVNETGTSLSEIELQVGKVNEHIQSIVTASREQATALAEINAAVNQMDQVTQQNAAMVEETNAATQGLSGEAVKLEDLVGRFRLQAGAAGSAPATPYSQPVQAAPGSPAPSLARPAPPSPASSPAPSPARALGQKLASAFGGGAAKAESGGWDEF